MKYLFGPLVIAIAAVSASADASEPSDVITLTGGNFNDFVKANELVLAEFYAPWCGHCKKLAPEYERAATKLKDQKIPLVKVDCTEDSSFCVDIGVQGYPTLRVYRGSEFTPYQGGREYDDIVSYMTKQQLPVVSTITKDNHDEFITSDKLVVVCYLDKSDSADAKVFETVAESLRNDFTFGLVTDNKLDASEKRPSIVIYRTFDEPKTVYDGKIIVEELRDFIKAANVPLIGEIGPQTYTTYMESGMPLAYIFTEEADKQRLVDELQPLAKKFKAYFNVATIDATAFGAHASNLNLETKWPAIVIHKTEENLKFPLDQTKEITFAIVESFFEDFVSGKLEPSIKSEEIPTTQEGPVTVVVAKNYDAIVMDDSKDVLIELYAPWCGHCKKLLPEYEKLAKLYKPHSDKVVVAKCDATLNDTPEKIQGFPTIKLYAAKNKGEGIEYQGERDVAGLAAFIAEHGTYKVDVQDKIKELEGAEDEDSKTGEAIKSALEKLKQAAEAVVGGEEVHDEL